MLHYGEICCYKEVFKRKRPCRDCPALKTLKRGRTEHTEIKSEYKGESRYYYVTATPLKEGDDDKETLIIETVQDITNYKKVEEDLRRLNDFC